jgi:hypothetical protein
MLYIDFCEFLDDPIGGKTSCMRRRTAFRLCETFDDLEMIMLSAAIQGGI